MYTSGAKKVSVFPPGFNPAAGGPGSLGSGLKQPINTGTGPNASNPGLGQQNGAMGGSTNKPPVGAPGSVKQMGIALPKVGMAGPLKAPVKVPGFVPKQPAPGPAANLNGPPKVAPPMPAGQPPYYARTL